ncbi:hypothetical protein H6P81_019310 [Aristolochia fimbriata]|uniref:GDP-L-galactose phosphorylase 1 n=1 Tax=Aristolochia fimbriata TaxID=158543 RepID=A0AAV7DRD1_ARIFI|nr:hypothetical protein H6P81_019310 [Aristolochia fimbriata]
MEISSVAEALVRLHLGKEVFSHCACLQTCFLSDTAGPIRAGFSNFITALSKETRARIRRGKACSKDCPKFLLASPSFHGGRGALPSAGGHPADLTFLAGGGILEILSASMVSVKQFEDGYCSYKGAKASELSHFSRPIKDVRIPVYQFGSTLTESNVTSGVVPCPVEEQSLLDTLFLAQWEDRAWKGLIRYDVTTCETKVIQGRIGFVGQFNELCRPNCLENIDNVSELREELLFCVINGEKINAELIPSARVPPDADLVIANANPIEYGHVFMVPLCSHQWPLVQLTRSLEMVTKVAAEIKNYSFHAFYDYCPSLSGGHRGYFQACYFSNPLPVECVPLKPISGVWQEKGIHIGELEGYPLKTLSFKSKGNLQVLVTVVSKICSFLQEQKKAFNLLLSNCGTQVFLFLQVDHSSPSTLSAWECSGHFVFNSRQQFDLATEDTILKLLATNSLDEDGFQAVKLLCCEVAGRIAS